VARWAGWSRTAPDVGIQTSQVLGSLMRTAPVALAYLDDPAGLAEAAMAVSALTHFDPSAGEACVLWSLAIRHAVLTGELKGEPGAGQRLEGREEQGGAFLAIVPERDKTEASPEARVCSR
jgi:ADP-ribosyl-[dinitrogen reductase] hydrolase